jgi:antitoxin (DNA-binding transcriptional repressor) of toxin-antitoxin stability system
MAAVTVNYNSAREAREHFKDLLDAADEGLPTTVTRDKRRIAAVDADRLVYFLTRLHPSGDRAAAESTGWSIHLPGIPVAADGATVEEAVEEMIDALRDYAEAWAERLRLAPNHADNWGSCRSSRWPRTTSCVTGCSPDHACQRKGCPRPGAPTRQRRRTSFLFPPGC